MGTFDMLFPIKLCIIPSVGREISTAEATLSVLCTGKVTVGLPLHQPSVTGSGIYPPTG